MRGMVLFESADIHLNPLRMTDLPDPQPGPGEVRLRVRCCGICRTDLHVIEGDLPREKRPVIPGHQIVGIVDALGDGSGRFRIGQRVGVAWLRHTCGQCDWCRAERENLCDGARFTGYHADGGYAELAVVNEDYAYDLPDSLDDAQAAPLLCAGIIGYRALERSDLPTGGRLGIVGFGSSAHVVLQIARYRGCEVFVATRGEEHRQLARELGATWVGENIADVPAKVDSAILFAPVGHLVPPVLEALKKGGTLAIAGIYLSPIPALDYEKHLFHERNVRSVTANTRMDGIHLLAEAAAAGVHPHVVSYPLSSANIALQDLKDDRISGTGILTIPN
jgi:alcohol dehydrogenase, propanol-preferring